MLLALSKAARTATAKTDVETGSVMPGQIRLRRAVIDHLREQPAGSSERRRAHLAARIRGHENEVEIGTWRSLVRVTSGVG